MAFASAAGMAIDARIVRSKTEVRSILAPATIRNATARNRAVTDLMFSVTSQNLRYGFL